MLRDDARPDDGSDIRATPHAGDPVVRPALAGAQPRTARRVMALAEVLLCSGFTTQLFVIQALAVLGWAPLADDGSLSLAYVGTLSMLDSILLVALIVVLLRAQGESPLELLLGRRSWRPESVLGLMMTPGIFLLAMGAIATIRFYAPGLHNVPVNPLAELIDSPTDAGLFVVVAIAAGGIREEVQRAFILRRFEQHLGGALLGLLLFSIAFGAGHALQGWDTAIVTGLLGAVWGLVYLRRRSIIGPVVSHSLFNVGQIIFYVAALS